MADAWTKTERTPAVDRWAHLTLTIWTRADGRYTVGNSVGTIGERREWYVQTKGYGVHFRKRFATAENAMRAVDARDPLKTS